MLLALLLAIGSTSDAAPPVEPPAAPAPAADEAPWVDFTLTPAGQVRFLAEVDGRTVSAILDTGVSHSVLSRASAAYDPRRARDGGRALGVGGGVAIGWMRAERVAFAGVARTGGEVAVAELPANATGGAPAELLVGRDLLAAYALDIDYPAQRFRLLRSGRLPFAGDVAPLALSPGRQVYESVVTLGGRRVGPVIVDTGDGGQLTLTAAGWQAGGIAAPVTSALSYGVGGAETTGLAIAPAVALGDAATGAVEVRIEPAGGLSQRIGVAGRVGSGLLKAYRVLLDPGAGRMVLRREAEPAGPARATSGLLVARARDRLRVVHVMQGGPAAATGWRAGEEVCAVDGAAVTGAGGADWVTGAPGRTVSLRLCDGARRALTLQRFY